jgi:hypothetical protein
VPYMWLGRSWMDRGNHKEARRLISGAIQYDPWNPRYRFAYLATFLSPSLLTKTKKLYGRFRNTTSSKNKISGDTTAGNPAGIRQ